MTTPPTNADAFVQIVSTGATVFIGLIIAALAWTRKISELFPKKTETAGKPTDTVVISAAFADSKSIHDLQHGIGELNGNTEELVKCTRLNTMEVSIQTEAINTNSVLLRKVLQHMIERDKT